MAARSQRGRRKIKAPRRPGIGRLSVAEDYRVFDQAARRYLGMSGRAFLTRWRAGAFPDVDADPGLRHVAMLAPVGC